MTHDYDPTSTPPPDHSFIGHAPGRLTASQSVAPESDTGAALERLSRMVAALDTVAATFQAEQPAEPDIPGLVADTLRTLGIESYFCLFDPPRGAAHHTLDTASASNTAGALRITYISLAPGVRRAVERITGRAVVGTTLPLERGDVFEEVLRTRQPRYLGDTLTALRQLAPELPELAARQLLRLTHSAAAVVAPMLARGRPLGLMSMWADDLRPEDTSILAAFARETSTALDGARLSAEMARRSRRMAALTEAGRDLLASFQVDEVLEHAADHAARSLETAHSSIWLVEPPSHWRRALTGADLHISPLATISGSKGERVDRAPGDLTAPVPLRLAASFGLSVTHRNAAGALIAGAPEGAPVLMPALRALHTARPQWHPDLQRAAPDQLHPDTRRLLLVEGYHEVLAAPLLTPDDQVIGAVAVYARQARTFAPDDGAYLETLGRQIVAALAHALTFSEAESAHGLLEAVFDANPAALAVLEGPDDTLWMANSRLRALSVCPERDPVGLSIHQLFPAGRMSLVNGLRSTLAAVRHTRRRVMLRGVALHDADGSTQHTVTLHIAPIRLRSELPSSRHPSAATLPTSYQPRGESDALLFIVWDTTAHVQAEDRLAAQVRRAETLARVALALGHERELPALLQQIAQAAVQLTNADTAGFLLRASPDERFQVAATAGVPPATLSTLHRHFVTELSILRPLLTTGEPLLIDDATAVAARAEARLLARGRVHALAATPLTASGGWIQGTLVVGHHVPGSFTAEHAELLEALAAQAVAAVERTRALEQARRHAEDLEATFTSIAEGVAIYDEGGILRRMNAAGERITRQRLIAGEDTAIRQQRFGLRHADGAWLSEDELPSARAVHGETFYGAEYLVDGEDGPETVISVSGAPLLDTAGQVRGGVVVFRNVTQVRQLERRTHEALDALLGMAATLVAPTASTTSAPSVLSSQRADGLATSAPYQNALHATLRQFCLLAIEVLGCDRVGISLIDPQTGETSPAAIAGLQPAEDAIWVREQQAQAQRQGAARFGEDMQPEIAAKLRAGETVILDLMQPPYSQLPNLYGAQVIMLVPMQVEGQLVGLLALDHRAHDLSAPIHTYSSEEVALAQGVARLAALAVERQRLERMVAEVEALRAANALKEEFLSIASHELKTPLTVLQARTQATQRRLIRMGHADAAAQFATVQTSLDRILALVQELLDASRIQAGQLDLRLDPCDLGRLIQAAVNEEHEASKRVIVLSGQDDADLWVAADAERLAQVLTNLIDNAVKYSRPEQPINVRVWRQPPGEAQPTRATSAGDRDLPPSTGDEVIITVTDAGVGIPPDEVDQVFKRFYRARTSSSRNYGGLGLGLHIAATIVERHGGRIWATSAGPGQGSTFGVALPAIDPPGTASDAGDAAPPYPPAG